MNVLIFLLLFSPTQTDRTLQAIQYIEAVLFFIQTGNAVEQDRALKKTAFHMYEETLNLIQLSSLKFRQQGRRGCQSGEIDAKIQIFSLRCQSFLYYKLFKMRRLEDKELSKELGECHRKVKIIQFSLILCLRHNRNLHLHLNCLLHYYKKVQHQ